MQSIRFERTVQFVAFNLEERQTEEKTDGRILRGSRAFATHAQAEDWQIVGVFNLETIAYAGDNLPQEAPAGLPIDLGEVGDFVAIVGNEASAGLAEAFTRSITRYEIPLPCVPLLVPGKGEMLPDTRRSDHAPFWDAGYPALMLTDTANFRNPHYHQPGDRLDTLNLSFTTQVCRATGATVVDLAGLVSES
jgi:Zn-dependent M28 family amino/carboxypeptidase